MGRCHKPLISEALRIVETVLILDDLLRTWWLLSLNDDSLIILVLILKIFLFDLLLALLSLKYVASFLAFGSIFMLRDY